MYEPNMKRCKEYKEYDIAKFLTGIPIIITTRTIQNKKHKKKRINKKWLKKYGTTDYEIQPDDCLIIDGKVYVTRSAYERLKLTVKEIK